MATHDVYGFMFSYDICFFAPHDTNVFDALVAYFFCYRMGHSDMHLFHVSAVDRISSESVLSTIYSAGGGSSNPFRVWNARMFLTHHDHGSDVGPLEYSRVET